MGDIRGHICSVSSPLLVTSAEANGYFCAVMEVALEPQVCTAWGVGHCHNGGGPLQ